MKIAGKIATVLLLMVYIAAFVGFRLHECAVDHTVEILGVLEGEACEEVHHHHCEAEACRHHHHHHHCEEDRSEAEEDGVVIAEAGCCTNSLHVLSDAQIASDGGDEISAAKCLQAVSVSAATAAAATRCGTCSTTRIGERLALTARSVLALYSVRRV